MAWGMTPQLSIVVPTHNRPGMLPRAVASAVAQEGVAVEVVVVDDGSSPPAQVPPGVRLIRLQPGRGGAAARNAGWMAARAPLVALLDDDDELLPHFAAVSDRSRATWRSGGPRSRSYGRSTALCLRRGSVGRRGC